jgi:heme exporter protein D
MQWGSISEFFAMGGYGLYVWGAYAMTAGVIAVEVLALMRRNRTPGASSGRSKDASD